LMDTWSLSMLNPVIRSVGYRQVYDFLQGDYDIQTCAEKGIAATRQLAKRQLTWLRHWPHKQDFIAENPQILDEMVASIEQILDNLKNYAGNRAATVRERH
jgi:tRNA dimethylallyltransferase